MNPKYLFCDEPNSGLDQTSILIDELVHGITEKYNITTVVNPHDIIQCLASGKYFVFVQGREMLGRRA